MKVILTAILLLLLASCAVRSIDEIVADEVVSQIANVDETSFRIRATRTFDGGTVALFSADDVLNPPDKLIGFSVFTRSIIGWSRGMDGVMARDVATLSGTLIDYRISDFDYGKIGRNLNLKYVLVWGEIFSSDVTAVIIVLDDGTALRDDGTGQVFAVSVAKPSVVCEIKVLGENEELLESITPEYERSPAELANCQK